MANFRLCVILMIAMPKLEVGGAQNLQRVQCNDRRIAIPGFKPAAITALRLKTKIGLSAKWAFFSNPLT